jgi:hypothetical protein
MADAEGNNVEDDGDDALLAAANVEANCMLVVDS